MNISDELHRKYQISDKCLGKGSFSSVYLGKRIKDELDIAIKIINLSDANDKVIEYINQEVTIMNTIKKNPHPNIVECFDVIRLKKRIYIIMEFCENEDLGKYLTNPINESYAQFYFAQLSSGLKYLSAHGIVHRDIKPKNILLKNKRKVLKIADFGLAKLLDSGLLNTMVGSPLYMSPEVMYGKEYNSQTDLWSLGMILFEMLYGFHPYQHCKNATELLHNVKKDQLIIPPHDNTNLSVSDECLSLLRMLLQKNVSRRITWTDFFTHPWINKWEYVFETNQIKNKANNELISVSLSSFSNNKSNIETYMNKCAPNSEYALNNNQNTDETILHRTLNESNESNASTISTILSESVASDYCQFKMEEVDEQDDIVIKRNKNRHKSNNSLTDSYI